MKIKIEKLEETNKGSNKWFYLVVIIIVFLGIGLILGLKYWKPSVKTVTLEELHQLNLEGKLPPEKGFLYKGLSFVNYDGLWWTNVKIGEIIYGLALRYNPKNLTDIFIKGRLNDTFSQEEIYFSLEPLSINQYLNLAATELGVNMVKRFNIKVVPACSQNLTESCLSLPVVNCQNKDKAVIYFNQSSEKPEVEFKDNCLIVHGQGEDLIRATEKLIYFFFNIN